MPADASTPMGAPPVIIPRPLRHPDSGPNKKCPECDRKAGEPGGCFVCTPRTTNTPEIRRMTLLIAGTDFKDPKADFASFTATEHGAHLTVG